MIVIDTSALCEIARRTDKGKALQCLMFKDEAIISCELIRAEAANVFRKLTRIENLSAAEAEMYLAEGLKLINEFYSLKSLQTEALRESIRYSHPTYDMFYFVLARRHGATLFTIDKKLASLCEKHGVDCISEIEFPSE